MGGRYGIRDVDCARLDAGLSPVGPLPRPGAPGWAIRAIDQVLEMRVTETIIAVCAKTFVPVGGKLGRERHVPYHSTEPESERHRRIKHSILEAAHAAEGLTAELECCGAIGRPASATCGADARAD